MRLTVSRSTPAGIDRSSGGTRRNDPRKGTLSKMEPPGAATSLAAAIVLRDALASAPQDEVKRLQEVRMLRLAAAVLALAAMASSAIAQTSSGAAGQVTTPSGQNSAAGIPGQPGSKNGPAARPPSATTGTGASSSQSPTDPTVRQQDPAKIQGLPGNKSGPAAKPGTTGR